MTGLMEVEYEITSWLSIGTMTFDLGWPWTVLVKVIKLARQIFQKS